MGVLAVEDCCEGKLAGWKRGRDGSFSEPLWFRRCEFAAAATAADLGWSPRCEGGCMFSYREAGSKRGESGDWGLMAGEGRGEGIRFRFAARGDIGRRTGERPLDDEGRAVVVYLSDEARGVLWEMDEWNMIRDNQSRQTESRQKDNLSVDCRLCGSRSVWQPLCLGRMWGGGGSKHYFRVDAKTQWGHVVDLWIDCST